MQPHPPFTWKQIISFCISHCWHQDLKADFYHLIYILSVNGNVHVSFTGCKWGEIKICFQIFKYTFKYESVISVLSICSAWKTTVYPLYPWYACTCEFNPLQIENIWEKNCYAPCVGISFWDGNCLDPWVTDWRQIECFWRSLLSTGWHGQPCIFASLAQLHFAECEACQQPMPSVEFRVQ